MSSPETRPASIPSGLELTLRLSLGSLTKREILAAVIYLGCRSFSPGSLAAIKAADAVVEADALLAALEGH